MPWFTPKPFKPWLLANHRPEQRLRTAYAIVWITLLSACTAQNIPSSANISSSTKSLAEYSRAAEQGNAAAQAHLGWIYESGDGVPQNDIEAVRLYKLAAGQGNADGQTYLGLMYEVGAGVPQSYSEAIKLYKLAADQGHLEAAQNLARLSSRLSARNAREQAPETSAPSRDLREVPLQKAGGVLVVPVTLNGEITFGFTIDSGAADVSVPADVVLTLMRTGTLKAADFLGTQTYILANGSTVPSQTFRITSLKVGDRTLEHVKGSVASVQGSLLLGQSFLSRFKSWSIDNQRHVLILE